MKFSILTISDSCFLQPENDKGGPLIKELLLKSQKLGSVEIVNHSIVPDDVNKISQYLTNQRHFCDVILTTGGTGLSSRDVTPEATRSVIERECNGISTGICNVFFVCSVKMKYSSSHPWTSINSLRCFNETY